MCWWAKPPSTALNNQIYGSMVFSFCIDSTHSTIQPQRDRVHFAQNIFIIGLGAVVLIIINYLWYLVAYDAALITLFGVCFVQHCVFGLSLFLLHLWRIFALLQRHVLDIIDCVIGVAVSSIGWLICGVMWVLFGVKWIIGGIIKWICISAIVWYIEWHKLRSSLGLSVAFGASLAALVALYLASASSLLLVSLFVGATVTAIACLTSIPFQASLRGYGLFITEYFARIRNAHIRISDFLLVALVAMVLGASVLALCASVLVLSFAALSHGCVFGLFAVIMHVRALVAIILFLGVVLTSGAAILTVRSSIVACSGCINFGIHGFILFGAIASAFWHITGCGDLQCIPLCYCIV